MTEDMEHTPRPAFWDQDFERNFGEALTAAIHKQYPGSESAMLSYDKDFFYYKLALLRALNDPAVTVPEPTDVIGENFEQLPISKRDFEELRDIMRSIRQSEPDAADFMSDELLQKCEEVIENFDHYADFLDGLDTKGGRTS